MHSIRTTVVTDSEGAITGYGLSIEAQVVGEPAEIAAAFAASLDLIKQAVISQIAQQIDPPAGYAPAAPPQEAEPPQEVAQPAQKATPAPADPPRTAEEAERRFFARYSETIGGESWLDVREYLRTQEPKPTTVEGWIAVAAAVRDASRAAQAEAAPTEPPAAPRRTSRARAAA